MMLEFRDESGDKKRLSLKHTDFERGKEAADTIAAKLRKGEGPRVTELTLKALFDMYEREKTPLKGASGQAHDRRARVLFEKCWGGSARVKELDQRDWDRFIDQRRSGRIRPEGGYRKLKGVRDRAIEQDLKFLLAVCNWAEVVRINGQPLLDRNPFKGFKAPSEVSPNRPSTSDEEYQRLREVAAELGSDVELYLLLSHETGHRCTALGRIRWSDVDLTNPSKATIRWRQEHDKIGLDHTVPLSPKATEALIAARRGAARIGDGWVFPSPKDPDQPIRRDLLRDWWQKLERKAGLKRVKGRGWHSLRRKFATELKKTPLADLCYMGGWKDAQTMLKCYIKPDERTMRDALLGRAERRTVGE